MNPKIKELAEQTGIYMIPNSKPISIGGSVADLEKFAELIIQECVEVAYSYDEPKMSGCGLIIGNSIESHFGIE